MLLEVTLDGAYSQHLVGLRVRARAGGRVDAARVTLRRVNRIFMLDSKFTPQSAPGLEWDGALRITADGTPVEVPFPAR